MGKWLDLWKEVWYCFCKENYLYKGGWTMRTLSKKTVGTMLAIIMMLMGTLSVHAATYTGEYGSGTYTATLQFTSSYTVVALSYSPESPSDTQYTSVDGYIEYVSGGRRSVAISGFGGCYQKFTGKYDGGSCNYHIGSTTVKTISIL